MLQIELSEPPQDVRLSDRFRDFLESEWDLDTGYTLSDIAFIFEIDIRLARYHLMRLVDQGELCVLKHEGHTLYMHREWKRVFEQFIWIPGVRVL